MRKRDTRQSSFSFEEPAPPAPKTFEDTVPQAVFLSWPSAMQYAYCAARDRDSATTAHLRGEDPSWYLERAKLYETHTLPDC